MRCGRAFVLLFPARVFCAVCLTGLAVSVAFAQRGGLNDPQQLNQVILSYSTAPGTAVLIFHVYAERSSKHLGRQALLKLINPVDKSAVVQTTDDNSQGVYTNIPYGAYEVEASAVGYISEHKDLRVMNSARPMEIEIVLHPDPTAIRLDAADVVMSPKARKDAKHAISFLKSGDLEGAQKQLDQAYKLSPSSPDLNFLLGYLYFQKKDFAHAGSYLETATTLNPHNAQALTLLGRTGLERQDYPAARSALEQAVLADAENWLPHNLLADAYLHQKNYDQARDEAELAIAKGRNAGKGIASPARLVLGEALVGLGREEEGIQALNTFLNESPHHPMAGEVRSVIAQINSWKKTFPGEANTNGVPGEAASLQPPASNGAEKVAPGGVRLFGFDPLEALSPPDLTYKAWQPPSLDEVKPNIVPNVECPASQVIEESGNRVQELVEDVARFAAVEDLFHQSLDKFGIPIRTETRKYNYVASISEPEPGFIAVDEYRAEKLTLAGYPDRIASTGFAALALVFHPHMRENFTLTCEGLGDWHGQASWLVHFQQREDRPSRMHSYRVGNQMHPVDLRGRAWITADKFQIVRIEAEIVKPIPEIQLLSEHQIVEYGPVPFSRKNTTLWLPKSVEIYFDFRKHRYYRKHSFDHFMLYSVESEEKRNEPAVKPEKSPG